MPEWKEEGNTKENDNDVEDLFTEDGLIEELDATIEDLRERFTEKFVNEFDYAASHVDAYNVFVTETVPIIIADTPEIAQVRKSTNEVHVFCLHNPRMARPVFVNPETGLQELLMPQQARMRNMSYNGFLYVDISYTRHRLHAAASSGPRPEGEGGEDPTRNTKTSVERFFRDQNMQVQERLLQLEQTHGPIVSGEMHVKSSLGQIPVMTGSVLCNSNACGPGEEIATRDPPGLFISTGSPRIISPISRLCWNQDFTYRRPKKKFAAEAEVRSCHDTRMHRSTATLKLQYTHPNPKVPMKGRQILVNIPFLAKPIHLAVVFLALGWSLNTIPIVVRTAAGKYWFPEFDGMMKALLLSCKITTEEEALLIIAQSSKKSKAGATVYHNNHTSQSNHGLLHEPNEMAPTGNGAYSIPDQIRYARLTLRRELLPHVGLTAESNTEKGLYLGDLVWKLFMVATHRRAPDDRDDYSFKRFDPAGVLMGNLLRQVVGIHMRQRKQFIAKIFEKEERSGKEKRPISIPTVFTDTQITMRFASCFGTGKWTASKGGCMRMGVARCPSHVNKVAAACELSRLSSPLKQDGKHVNARLIATSQYGRVDPTETPEGRSCGLVMYLCMGAKLSIGMSPRPLLALIEAYGDDFGFLPLRQWGVRLEQTGSLACFDDLTKVRVDGIPMGWVSDPLAFTSWLRTLRRSGTFDDEVSCYHDDHYHEIIVRQDAGRILRPLYLVDKMETVLRRVNWTTVGVSTLMAQGALEYVDALEEKSFATAFGPADRLKREQRGTRITHMEIDGSFQFGLATSQIPQPQSNQCPRNTYQCAMSKQALSFDPWHLGLHRSKQELYYPQRPFQSTKTGKLDNYAYQASGSNASVILYSDPMNQEDALKMRQQYAERGAFTSSNCRMYKDHQRKSGTNATREIFKRPDPLTCGGRKDANYDKADEDTGIVALNTRIVPNDALICKITAVRTQGPPPPSLLSVSSSSSSSSVKGVGVGGGGGAGSIAVAVKGAAVASAAERGAVGAGTRGGGAAAVPPISSLPSLIAGERGVGAGGAGGGGGGAQMKYRCACVLARGEPGYVSESIATTNAHGLGIRKVEVSSEREPEVGDKFSSRHGQKGVVGCMVADEDMPYQADGTIPDIAINSNCIASRMTISQLREGVASTASAASGIDFSDATAFKPLDMNAIRQVLIKNGLSPSGNAVYYNPITGEPFHAEIFTGFVFYQRLRHMVIDKMHARGPSGPVETVTRQALEGRGREGGQRVGEMEKDCIVGHGAIETLHERLCTMSDPWKATLCKQCGFQAFTSGKTGLPFCTHCGTGEHVRLVDGCFAFHVLGKELLAMGLRMGFELQDIQAPPPTPVVFPKT